MFGPRGAPIPQKFHSNRHSKLTENGNNIESHHWCETCDRAFKTSALLENHKKEHQRCKIDGCSFIAHPKVITKHIQMQHSSGLYNKISKLNDPEEIEKWRQERRNKFPTKANIEKKNAVVREKIERGEKMGLQKKKFPGDSNNNGGRSPGIRKRSSIMRRRPKKIEKACPAITVKHHLPAFTGISHLLIESEENTTLSDTYFDIDDELDDFIGGDGDQNNMVCGAITQLIADYGSSGDEDTVNIVNNKNQKVLIPNADSIGFKTFSNVKAVQPIQLTTDHVSTCETNKLQVNVEKSDDSGPEEIITVKTREDFKHMDSKTEPEINLVKPSEAISKPNASKPSRVRKRSQNMTRKLPSTLLEKLLSNEIRHERNIMLQCIRYIVKNKYFDRSPSR